MNATTKITSSHLERTACVYVRQSTIQQVREHLEGQRRQYALAERAKQLGFKQVLVVDDDLGRSGSGSQERPGFGRLLQLVCEGSVGAVFALEASRLARNNRDWHHLVDLCAITSTVLVDDDGVYDPRHLNDRLLLGLKGTMSEFELGLLRQRAQAAFLEKVRRGAAMWEVPVGYVRTEDDQIEKIADVQVQRAMDGVFSKLRELGSARQVAIWYSEEKIQLPSVTPGTRGREITWRLPTCARIRSIIKNPCYAGAFAYGQRGSKTVVRGDRARMVRGHRKPRGEWRLLIRDHHAGYITWDEYVQNQQLMESNMAKWSYQSSGAPREGTALLAGLLRCARCGCKLGVVYSGRSGRTPRYCCKGRGAARGAAACLSVGGLRVDEAVSEQILDVVKPVAIEAAVQVADEELRGEDEKQKALELALEKARYQARRIERQYDATDPENRLVAAELEARWNVALGEVAELESRLKAIEDSTHPLGVEERRQLTELATDLPSLWHHPCASNRLKKRVARVLLSEIVIDVNKESREALLRLHWAGGLHTELHVPLNLPGKHRRSAERELVDLVRDLAKVCKDGDTARVLNRLGYRTGQGLAWRASRVEGLRRYHDIPGASLSDEWTTLEGAARILGVSNTVVSRLIKNGALPAKQVVAYAPWVIDRKDLELREVVRAVREVQTGAKTLENRPNRPRTASGQTELPF